MSFPATSKSFKDAANRDTDNVQPNMLVGMFDNIRAVQLNQVIDTFNDFNGFI